MAAVSKNIKRIKDTLANIIAGLADGKSALLTDQKNEHIHRVGSDFFFPAMSKKTADGSSYTYLDSEFNDLDVHNELTVDGATTLSGAADVIGDLDCAQNAFVGEKLGVGTDAPAYAITAEGSNNDDGASTAAVVSNTLATQGNGTTTKNRANVTVAAGNATVYGYLKAFYESAGTFLNSIAIGSATNHNTHIVANNLPKITVTPGGVVGINNLNPLVPLHISEGTTPQLYLSSGGDNATEKILSLYYDVANSRAGIQSVHNGTGETPLILNPAGGNVGVGITNPAHKLSVAGDTYVSTDLTVGDDLTVVGDSSLANTDIAGNLTLRSTRKTYSYNADGASKAVTLFTLDDYTVSGGSIVNKTIFVDAIYYGLAKVGYKAKKHEEYRVYTSPDFSGAATAILDRTHENYYEFATPVSGYTITVSGLDVILTMTGSGVDTYIDVLIKTI